MDVMDRSQWSFQGKWRIITVTYINVHPYVMLLADIGNLMKRIESSHHRCSGSAVDKKRLSPFTFVLQNHFL